MKVELLNGKLVVTIEATEPTPSSTGKTLVVASTHGNVTTEVMVDEKPITVGVNAYIASNGNHPYAKTGEKCVKLVGKDLVITIPLQKAAPSASGKTMVIASTHGNLVTDAKIANKNVILGLNAYYHN